MLEVHYSKQFKKDYKLALKVPAWRGFQESFFEIVDLLINLQELPSKYSQHKLIGNYQGCLECHIKSDLLLIYRSSASDLELIRLGKHSNLFNKY